MATGSSTAAVKSDGWEDYQPQTQTNDEGWQDYQAPPAVGSVKPPSAGSRFVEGMKAGTTTPGAERFKDTGDPSQLPTGWDAIPGSGVVRDIRARNYAGAAGRIAGPALEIAPFLVGGRNAELPPTEVRPINVRGPGEIAPTMTRPQARYAGIPPEPIPGRSGLQLRGEVAKPIEGEYLPAERSQANEAPFAPAMEVAPRPPEPIPAPYRRTGDEIIQDEIGPPPEERFTAGRIPPREGLRLQGEVAPIARPNKPVPWYPPRASQWNTMEIGGPEDVAETRGIQDTIRDQAENETQALRRRGNEEGYFRNTRLRTPKGVLTGAANEPVKLTTTPSAAKQAAKQAKASGRIGRAPGLPKATGDEDLTDILTRSVEQAKAKKQ